MNHNEPAAGPQDQPTQQELDDWRQRHEVERDARASDPRQRELVAKVLKQDAELEADPELVAFSRQLLLVHEACGELRARVALWNRMPIVSASDFAVVEDRTQEPKARLELIERRLAQLEELDDAAGRALLDALVLDLGLTLAQPATESGMAVSRSIANARRVLAALTQAGFDPLRLPRLAAGKSCLAKKAAKGIAGLTTDQFKEAWQTLLDDGRIARER